MAAFRAFDPGSIAETAHILHNKLHNITMAASGMAADKPQLKWLKRRGGVYHYLRRVPAKFAHVDSRTFVEISCETSDFAKAIVTRDKLNAATEQFWVALSQGMGSARERYTAAVDRAKLEGFSYVPIESFVEMDLRELGDRLERIEEVVGKSDRPAASPANKQLVAALLGGERSPEVLLSTALDEYERHTREERLRLSPEQARRWRITQERPIQRLIDLVGDKPVGDLTRADANAFRQTWVERIELEKLSPASANKEISTLSKIFGTVSDRLDLQLPKRFSQLRFDVGRVPPRQPFSTEHLRNVLLTDTALAGLNADARSIFYILAETGARPSEIASLRDGDFHLEARVPHISIEPYDGHELKTTFSERTIPLVGIAIEAAAVLKAGNKRYSGKSNSLSAVVNKFLKENKLLERKKQSLYSLRHSFKDRLTAASAPDIIDAELMGHKFGRPEYGSGPTLELKLDWLRKITLTG